MFLIFTMLFGQELSDPTAQTMAEFNGMLARAEEVQNRSFDCMEEETRRVLRERISDATEDIVVGEAIEACSYLREVMRNAIVGPDSDGMASEVPGIVNEWFEQLRETYTEQIRDFLLKTDFAEQRVRITSMEWRMCIDEKAADWSRLDGESADVIATAVMSSCTQHEENVRLTTEYMLRSNGVRPDRSQQLVSSTAERLRAAAIETVVSQRASLLPSN